MTRDKTFKRVVRSRMAETGETYAQAHRALDGHAEVSTSSASDDAPPAASGPARQEDQHMHANEVAMNAYRVVLASGETLEIEAESYMANRGNVYFYDGSTWDPLESTCRHASLSIL